MSDEITIRGSVTNEIPRDGSEDPDIGKWYWLVDRDGDRWIGCVTHVGSNYVEITSTHGGSSRIHFDEFWDCCTYEPNPHDVIRKNADKYRDQIGELTEEIKLLTSRLGVAPARELGDGGGETAALALRSGEPMPQYREALVKAKGEQLPALFKQIRKAAENMERWLKAESIPMKAQRGQMDALIDRVDRRILAVDLYAGLSEEAVKVRDGEPAEMNEPVHLLQRRLYMDEECLARYKHGGMEFKDIEGFDKWMLEDGNWDRILPFERCMVAFRVRRNRKERRGLSISDFIQMVELARLDYETFLYIRNGEQLWRVNTRINFGEKLFPDSDRQLISSGQKMWVKMFSSRVEEFISDNEYQGIIEEHERKVREQEKMSAEWDAATAEERKERGLKWPGHRPSLFYDYRPFDPSDIYYDDMVSVMEKEIEEHNRVVMVLQGILDRSEILHPHPPWKIWSDDGFRAGIRLVFDRDRALVGGEKPDFEAYRRRLNASLKEGSITIGQEYYWMRKEAEKENDRRERDWRTQSNYREVETFCPYGNPGPGELAKVVKFMPRARKATFHWHRERQSYDYSQWGRGRLDPWIHTKITCPDSELLNVSAYTPGDFRQFFDDPRTRAEYLEWAPMLLMAEEYHAGNAKVGPENGPKEDEEDDGS